MIAKLSTGVVLLLAICACHKASPTSPSAGGGPRTVYLSPAGSNANAGSATAPWQTLRHALSQLRAGDTLYLRDGIYTGPENTIDSQLGTMRSGTSFENAVTIAAAPSESVTIQPPDGYSGIRLTNGAPAYLIFQDLVIDMVNQTTPGGAGATGVFVANGAHHIRFVRLEVKNNSGNGFGFGDDSPFNEVIGCIVHDNGNYPGINLGYGFYVSSSDNLLDGNEVYNNNGFGMHLYDFDGPLNVARNVIRNNRIHGNGGGGGTNYGIVVAWGDGNVIHDNEIYDNPGGILVYTNSTNAQVYNNTLRSITHFEGILIQFARGTVVRDNLLNGSRIVDLGVDTVLSNNH